MFRILAFHAILFAAACAAHGALSIPDLPSARKAPDPFDGDWLIAAPGAKAGVYRGENANEIVMTNGLVRRVWRIMPNAATVAYDNLMTGASIIRGIKPEAVVAIDGARYDVGGLDGQPDYAYLKPEWVDGLTARADAFQLAGIEAGKTAERFPWKRVRHSADLPWPPPGASLTIRYAPPAGKLEGVTVSVHYEMFDGVPLLAKWISIANGGGKPVQLESFISEVLAAVETESSVDVRDQWKYTNIHVETDFGYGGAEPSAARRTV
ncbi:MAG: hypothetical protein FJY92_12195, partial [Candidatus Hydrogenedentes bacterium]|nr:hypothetical protein [Candidatus Hydrogenedentota bacterium]